MKLLFSAAFQTKKLRWLVAIMVTSMILVTLASQMEIVALGILTKKGPDFFELFGSKTEEGIVKSGAVTKAEVESRWDEIDRDGKSVITLADAERFIAHSKRGDILQKILNITDRFFFLEGNLAALAFLFVIVAIFKAITLFSHRYATRLVAIIVSRNQRLRYFEHIQSLPMSFYQKYEIGSLSNRVVGDAFLVAEAINSCMVNYLQTPFVVATTLILCFFTSWQLSLLIFLGVPLIAAPIIFLARRVKKVSRQILTKQEHFASTLIDFIAGIQTVKMFAMEDFSLKKYTEQNDVLADLERKSAKYDLSTRPVVHTMAMILLASAMLYGLYVLQMGVSEVLVFCGFLYIFYEPIKKFAEENSHIQRGLAAAERMQEVMELKPQVADFAGAEELSAFTTSIEFKDVWFKYANDWVLRGVDFTVSKGETVAIVGATGAGKSTIVQLLSRLYDIQKGEITIDGKPLTAYTQKSVREMIAVVPQKPFLFIDTVAANIAFGRGFSEDEITSAARRAQAEEFILRLPKGYQTILAEAGKDLSGGQQQRLAIARALIKNVPILVMDEATSSLDMVSEQRIKEAIELLRGQVTQIIIAHRLSTIEHADKIVFLEDGRKLAEGSKEELISSCSSFRAMWELMNRKEVNPAAYTVDLSKGKKGSFKQG